MAAQFYTTYSCVEEIMTLSTNLETLDFSRMYKFKN